MRSGRCPAVFRCRQSRSSAGSGLWSNTARFSHRAGGRCAADQLARCLRAVPPGWLPASCRRRATALDRQTTRLGWILKVISIMPRTQCQPAMRQHLGVQPSFAGGEQRDPRHNEPVTASGRSARSSAASHASARRIFHADRSHHPAVRAFNMPTDGDLRVRSMKQRQGVGVKNAGFR